MDELRELVDLINSMPALALYILAGIFLYKTIIVGSVYGIIRLGLNHLHSWLTKPKEMAYTYTIDYGSGKKSFVNQDAMDAYRLFHQYILDEIIKKGSSYTYIHASDVADVRAKVIEALKEKKKDAS